MDGRIRLQVGRALVPGGVVCKELSGAVHGAAFVRCFAPIGTSHHPTGDMKVLKHVVGHLQGLCGVAFRYIPGEPVPI